MLGKIRKTFIERLYKDNINGEITPVALSTLLIIAAVTPFAVYRTYSQDWLMALIDWIVVLSMIAAMPFIMQKHYSDKYRYLVAFMYIGSAIATFMAGGIEHVYWMYPAIFGVYYLAPARPAFFIVSLGLLIAIPLIKQQSASNVFFGTTMTLLVTHAFGYVFSVRTQKQNSLLSSQALQDSLTKLGNRRALKQVLQNLIDQKDHEIPPQIVIFDIDNFKSINDKLGHSVGDEALIKLSHVLSVFSKAPNFFYRFGGDEFIYVIKTLNSYDVQLHIEQLRRFIEDNCKSSEYNITASFGVAKYIKGETGDEWLHRADKELFNAKRSGRNKVKLNSHTDTYQFINKSEA